MKRGEVVLVSGKGDYGKARPAVVVQADYFAEHLDSVTVCPFTSDLISNVSLRITIKPSPVNGLKMTSQLMVDKLQTYPRSKVYSPIGSLAEQELAQLDRELAFFLQLNQVLLQAPTSSEVRP